MSKSVTTSGLGPDSGNLAQQSSDFKSFVLMGIVNNTGLIFLLPGVKEDLAKHEHGSVTGLEVFVRGVRTYSLDES